MSVRVRDTRLDNPRRHLQQKGNGQKQVIVKKLHLAKCGTKAKKDNPNLRGKKTKNNVGENN